MSDQVIASQMIIKIAGAQLQQPVMDKLASLTVDQHTHLPHMFTARFQDADLALMNGDTFELAKEVEIMSKKENGEQISLMKGEITALEPEFREGMIAELVVRGFDRSHRLYRETKSKAYLNIKDSDLASQLASNAGLTAQVDATSTVYDHLFQHNQTDMELLLQRAWRIGYECFVTAGKLYFRKPPTSGSELTLTWGQELLSFTPRMSLAEQVDEVIVRGWDPEKQQPIVGRASSGSLFPDIGGKNGASKAGDFGSGKAIIVDQPVESQAEADALAKARLDELSGAFVEAEGVAYRIPDITAGKIVEIKALGTRFSGKYLITDVAHIFSPEGLRSVFHVRGSRTGLLSEQIQHHTPLDRWPGLVTAIVTNTEDPKKWGRVKVKFPWMTEDAESDWARVIGIGAGPEAGLFIMPDVNDEVLVAFLHGDFNQPVVLGGVWNGKHNLPPEAAGAADNEKPLVRTWHSRSGHKIAVYDDAENKIELVTKGGRSITLSDKDSKVEMNTSGVNITVEDNKVSIQANSDIELKADGNVKVNASANMELKASGNLDIQASGQVNIKGAIINLN